MALPETGPFLNAALLCEKVLQESDGTVSIVRMVDRVTVNVNLAVQGAPPVPVPLPPEQMPPVLVNNLTLFVSFKAGSATGRSTLKTRLIGPTGLQLLETQLSVLFDGGEDRGANLIMPLQLQLPTEGLYWFHLLLEDHFLSRVPLRLVYNRQGLTI